MKTLLPPLVALTIAGCASTPTIDYSTMDAGSVAAATTVSGSKFDAGSRVEAPVLKSEPRVAGDRTTAYDQRAVRLRASRVRSALVHQALVEYQYVASGWRGYDTASFPGGRTEPVTRIDRAVLRCYNDASCEFRETFGVELHENELRGKGDLEFRINSRAGADNVVTLPRNYIDGFLTVVDR